MKIIKICRSFAYKKNLGDYSNADFFCSQEVECNEDEADRVSEQVHNWCKEQVIKSLNDYIKEIKGEETKSESVDLPVK
jgi:hypothetical protein